MSPVRIIKLLGIICACFILVLFGTLIFLDLGWEQTLTYSAASVTIDDKGHYYDQDAIRNDTVPASSAIPTTTPHEIRSALPKNTPVVPHQSPPPPPAQKPIPISTPDPLHVQKPVSPAPAPIPLGALNAKDILVIVNFERAKTGLPPLTLRPELGAMASAKAVDMISKQYFAHVAPDGTDVAKLASRYDYGYLNIGENLAMGDFTSSAEVMEGWMNSPGHRANILNKNYSEIGISAVIGKWDGRDVWYAVQEFGRPESACTKPEAGLETKISATEADIKEKESTLNELKQKMSAPGVTQDDYNREAEEYNTIVSAYNALVSTVRADIDLYNSEANSYNTCIGG